MDKPMSVCSWIPGMRNSVQLRCPGQLIKPWETPMPEICNMLWPQIITNHHVGNIDFLFYKESMTTNHHNMLWPISWPQKCCLVGYLLLLCHATCHLLCTIVHWSVSTVSIKFWDTRPGKHTKNNGKSSFFHGKTHYTWWFSLVFCMFTRGYPMVPWYFPSSFLPIGLKMNEHIEHLSPAHPDGDCGTQNDSVASSESYPQHHHEWRLCCKHSLLRSQKPSFDQDGNRRRYESPLQSAGTQPGL